ncbi:hypothetical protein C1H46_020680 [Malus baccata]|uniref:Uncharacterized protein n=1 Tax=Malus baccata TaxID=106549 RepID=A0A540M4R6_MALBA|nr:hypothetical protein C1H46_020680 [Malus baccata]
MAFSFTELVEDETNMEWLVESWPRVKVLLSDVGFSSTLDVARRSITMTPTTATTTADHTASIANTRFFCSTFGKNAMPKRRRLPSSRDFGICSRQGQV